MASIGGQATTSSQLSREERLRRVLILCRDFTRNLGYVRGAQEHPAGWKVVPLHPTVNFFRVAHNNALDMCVLDWCKLFGDDRAKPRGWGEHYWEKVVRDRSKFESELLQYLDLGAADFEDYRVNMRAYRDKFVAHLDNERNGYISALDLAQRAVEFYYDYIVRNEAQPGDLAYLPVNVTILRHGYEECVQEAASVYSKLGQL